MGNDRNGQDKATKNSFEILKVNCCHLLSFCNWRHCLSKSYHCQFDLGELLIQIHPVHCDLIEWTKVPNPFLVVAVKTTKISSIKK